MGESIVGGGCGEIVLASGSPRRRDILGDAGFKIKVVSPDVEELLPGALPARELCLANARLKVRAVAVHFRNQLVLAADTVVSFQGRVFGKPLDVKEAMSNLEILRGETHEVMTGVAIRYGEKEVEFIEVSKVTFKDFSNTVIEDYLKEVLVLDKAGGYAIQDHGDWLVDRVDGDFQNVVGLPLANVLAHLREMGFHPPQHDA
ncbi:Maf family protein [Akkermansiaceae bacterium]|nr:Maf family protein [Akkermansiaceae bacterium]